MSLHHAAQHLASQGRHGDNMLVHMNPKEVAGLQALAQQKGTTLTRNPHTGMPEAFGLGDLNPFRIVQGKGEIGESGFGSMLIGAALMAAGMPPQMAGLVTGGATLAMGGNMQQALGQGLGAYGGASMAGAAGLGAPQAPAPGATPPTPAAAPTPPAAAAAATPAPTVPANYEFASSGMDFGGSSAPPPTLAAEQAANQVATATPAPATPAPATPAPPTEMSTIDRAGQFVKDYKWPLAGAGLLALTQEKPKGVQVEGQHPGYIRPYIYDPATQGLRALKPVKAPGYAAGGLPVEQMSNANAVGANTGYPQADISGHAYATPWQTPVSQNVVHGAADTGVDRMTGEMAFAGGGVTGSGGIDLHIPLDLGGGAQGANGYQAAGSGSGSLANEGRPSWAQQGMPYSYAHGMQQPQVPPQFGFAMQAMQQPQPQTAFSAGVDPMGIMSGAPRLASFGSQGGLADMLRSMLQKQGADQMSPDKRAQLQAMYRNAGMQVYAEGGMTDLGGYSDGGRLLKGPGDGVSDSIPAVIGGKQPARLADGEFVVPARIVSELGNGSTEAGARKLYTMMDRIQKARSKTTGKNKVAANSRADKYLPA